MRLDVLVAGCQPPKRLAPRAQLWVATFPSTDVVPHHYEVLADANGQPGRKELLTFYLCGNSGPDADALFDQIQPSEEIGPRKSAELVESVFDTVEECDRLNPVAWSPLILPPWDIVRVTHEGIEWVKGAPIDRVALCNNFDISGNAKATTAQKNYIPNSLGNIVSNITVQTYSASAGALNAWFTSTYPSANPAGSGYPAWTWPDQSGGVYPTATNCGSSGSPVFSYPSGTLTNPTYCGIGYHIASGAFYMAVPPQSTLLTDAQISSAIGDGSLLVVLTTASTGSGIAAGGGGGGTVTGGGGKVRL